MTRLKSSGIRLIGMRGHMRILPVSLVAAAALALGVAAPEVWAEGQASLSRTKIIFEFNATDQDAGIQIFLDGEPWKKLKIVSPRGRRIFVVQGKGSVKKLGLTELFFESEEPSLDELRLDELKAMFPEGDYRFIGRTVEGDKLVDEARLSHTIPDGPVIVSPSPAEGATVDPNDTVITWNEVTTEVTTLEEVEIAGYQVTVVSEDADPPLVFSVDLPASARSVKVPPEFLQAGAAYNLEVLAIERNGNQTITRGSFGTSG